MSILETFYILFKSDASGLKKGNDEAEKSTKELNTKIKESGETTNKVSDIFIKTTKSLTSMAAAAFSAYSILADFKNSLNYAADLNIQSQTLGTNIETLDKWDNAVRKTGGTAASFQSSISNLAKSTGLIPGVAINLLPQLSDIFQKIGFFKSFYWGRKLGLDDSLILLLLKGGKALNDIIQEQERLGVVTQKQAEIMGNFRYQLGNVEHAFRTAFLALGEKIIPDLTKFIDIFKDFGMYLSKNTDLIIGGLIGIGTAAIYFAAPFVISGAIVAGLTLSIVGLGVALANLYDTLVKIGVIKSVFSGVSKAWGWAENEIDKLLAEKNIKRQKALNGVGNPHGDSYVANPVYDNIAHAQSLLSQAANSRFNSQTTNSILNNRAFSRNNSINIGDITIQTQATDAFGIAADLKSYLVNQFNGSNGYFNDGIHA